MSPLVGIVNLPWWQGRIKRKHAVKTSSRINASALVMTVVEDSTTIAAATERAAGAAAETPPFNFSTS